jgi:UDP-N-acetylglucosamine 4-epimerase
MRHSLNRLFELIRESLVLAGREGKALAPRHGAFREGDVRHSLADITRARELLGYAPGYSVREGLIETAKWWIERTMTMRIP